ncbi:MAG: tRNA (adenosine(37)-N6)-dimethylallyltransferase MiaA, partial [bacterium]|nr:tRNA (adenosine(37)-N6)-dimethylallyltransferase MiaA [bacterium]
ALVDGLFNRQVSDPQIKRRLKAEIDQIGVKPLYERLQQFDPLSAQKIHPNDGHRIVRALEVFEITGSPISDLQNQPAQAAKFDPGFVGIERHRNHLYQLIEKRVDQMIANGLVHEVEMLQARGYHVDLNSMQTVGYREVFDFLQGKIDHDQMVRLIKQHTRNYAKRQLTWFRRDSRIRWYNLDEQSDFNQLTQEILNQLSL